jgi:hypothetical protein
MFNRKDAIFLTKLTRDQVDRLVKIGMINPTKVSHKKLLFSWSDILEMRFIYKLRQSVSLNKIREAKEMVKINYDDDSLRSKKIVVLKNNLLLEDKEKDISYMLTGKNQGQTVLAVVYCDEIIEDLEQFGQNNIVDFQTKKDDNYIPKMRYSLSA